MKRFSVGKHFTNISEECCRDTKKLQFECWERYCLVGARTEHLTIDLVESEHETQILRLRITETVKNLWVL
jgi:hypothetical protein